MTSLKHHLYDLPPKRVLCVGDIMLDHYVYGHVERVSPEAPVPVMRHDHEAWFLGGVGHVVRNLEALHTPFSLVTVCGTDPHWDQVAQQLEALSCGTCHVLSDPSRPTTVKTRYMCGTYQMLRVDQERTHLLDSALIQEAVAFFQQALPACEVVLCSDYGKGALAPGLMRQIIRHAKEAQKTVIVDPKGTDYSLYAGADVLTPNLKELNDVTRVKDHTPETIAEAAEALRQKHQIGAIVVTCGAQGMVVVSEGQSFAIPAQAREVFDVTGAGDTVIAVLATCLAGGSTLKDAVVLANTAAGLVVGKAGTATVTREEIALEMGRSSVVSDPKILSLDRLNSLVQRWRSQGLSVGFTNGCFDLLHPGHVMLLQEASGLCDRLIVALNSDSSVKTLKGPERPWHDEHARAGILAALACVDAVIVFHEETPLQLIQTLRPDILVKGGDYTPETVVGAEDLQGWGGAVHIIPLKPGFSTTSTIHAIRHKV